MTDAAHSQEPSYLVVVNDEDQYSIWPSRRPLPGGWRAVAGPLAKAEALASIEARWTDMRPRRLRLAMEDAARDACDARPSSVPALLAARASSSPSAAALAVDGEMQLTYGAWDAGATATARALAARGVGPGARVALVLAPAQLVSYAISYVGIMRAGATAVPLPPELPAAERLGLSARLGVCGAIGDPPPPADAGDAWHVAPRELAQEAGAELLTEGPRGEDPALILHTSGTTGDPKPVLATHANLLAAVDGLPPLDAGGAAVSFVHAMPPATNVGNVMLLLALAGAGRAVVLPAFEPRRYCELIAAHRASSTNLVPAMARWLLRSGAVRRTDLSSVRHVGLTAADIAPETLAELARALPSAELIVYYTSTEAWPAELSCVYDPARPTAVGRSGTRGLVEVRDRDGRPLPAGGTGEVWLRAPTAPQRRYLLDEEASRARFRDGWTATGDLGTLDADGFLHLSGRIEALVNVGGAKVAPKRVERALEALPGVEEAAVFGMSHEISGETVVAAVVTREPIVERELREALAGTLARVEVPQRIVRVEALPRTPLGKVRTGELRARIAAEPRPAPVAPRSPLEAEILQLWQELLGREDFGVHDTFFALGGHSLLAVQLVARLSERHGVPHAAERLLAASTVEQLARVVAQERERRASTARGARPRR